jgi:hypothetical protein
MLSTVVCSARAIAIDTIGFRSSRNMENKKVLAAEQLTPFFGFRGKDIVMDNVTYNIYSYQNIPSQSA